MGELRTVPNAKLFIATLIAADGQEKKAEFNQGLTEKFGKIDIVSPAWPFDSTDYYTYEMGENLVRRIVSFEKLFDPGKLAEVKLTTNQLEKEFTQRFRTPPVGRIINLDAGYLTLGQIVLATTKSYSHRIYLREEIWAEVTLRYYKGKYEKWEWTYPDYASGRYNDFWLAMREKLKEGNVNA